jgi:hypothetical protein
LQRKSQTKRREVESDANRFNKRRKTDDSPHKETKREQFFFPSLPLRQDDARDGTQSGAQEDETVAAASGGPSKTPLVDVARPKDARGENRNRSKP